MKKIKRIILTGLIFAVSAAVSGCSNVIEELKPEPVSKGLTYNINWTSPIAAALNQSIYELAQNCTVIEFGTIDDYLSGNTKGNPEVLSDSSKYLRLECGEKVSDAVCAYYNTTDKEIYILAQKKIVFEDDDLVSDGAAGFFANCSAAKTIKLDNIDTSSVTNMDLMFVNCEALTSLDLTELNTTAVKSMSYMFSGCKVLTELNISGENFNTSSVTDMSGMFLDCNSIETLDVTNLDTSAVTDMSQMFANCKAVKTLDLTNFDFLKVTTIDNMFYDCSALTTIYAAAGTDLSDTETYKEIISSRKVFYGCTSLVGGNGSACSSIGSSLSDVKYARIDGLDRINTSNSKPGYFTVKGSLPYIAGNLTIGITETGSGSEEDEELYFTASCPDCNATDLVYQWYKGPDLLEDVTTATWDTTGRNINDFEGYNVYKVIVTSPTHSCALVAEIEWTLTFLF